MENFFPLNDSMSEDSSDIYYPMAQMFMPTIQTGSFVDMLACSGEVQPSTPSFLASEQLQMEANIRPTEVPLHNSSPGLKVNDQLVAYATRCLAVCSKNHTWSHHLTFKVKVKCDFSSAYSPDHANILRLININLN